MPGGNKFKITDSNTGDYYVLNRKTGKRTYFDKNGKQIEQSVFLERNNAVIDSGNAMRRKDHVKSDNDSLFDILKNPVGKNTAKQLNAKPVGELHQKK